MVTKRVFIGFGISAQARADAGDYVKRLRQSGPKCSASWTRPENYHFTLCFLGDVAVERIPLVVRAAEEACLGHSAFKIGLMGTGVFPSSRKPRVLWLGTSGAVNDVVAISRST